MQVHRDILLSLADQMQSFGYTKAEILKRADINPDRDADRLGMIDSSKGIVMWKVIHKLTQYPLIGLSFGKNLTFSNLSWIAGLMQSSDRLIDAWKTFCDFSLLMGDMFFYRLEENASEVYIEYVPNKEWVSQDPLSASMACDHAMSLTLLISAFLCGQSLKPLKAGFAYTREAKYYKIYREIFNEVHFYTAQNRLSFSKETASIKVLSANKAIYDHMYEFCTEKLKEVQHKEKISSKVRMLLNQKNNFYTPKIEELATMLNMSARTLQRKLKEEGSSFQEINEELKIEQAKHLIAKGESSLKEIAYLVGYSSVQSFSRSFKNYEGVPPGNFLREKETICRLHNSKKRL